MILVLGGQALETYSRVAAVGDPVCIKASDLRGRLPPDGANFLVS